MFGLIPPIQDKREFKEDPNKKKNINFPKGIFYKPEKKLSFTNNLFYKNDNNDSFKSKFNFLLKESISVIGPIIFSYSNFAVTVSFCASINFACAPANEDSD